MNRLNLNEVLSKLDIEVLGENGKGWLLAQCPFAFKTHASGEDRNPDFWIKVEDNGFSGYHCFACKQKGSIPKLVKMLEKMRGEDYGTLYVEAAILDTDGKVGEYEVSVEAEYEPEPINPSLYAFQEAWLASDSRAYLANRGISEDTAKKLCLKYDPDTKRIVFPVMDNSGRTFGFTGRTILGKDYRGPKVKDYPGLRKERFLLGEHLVNPSFPFLVVEGLFALAHMIELGIDQKYNVVATMGAAVTKFQRDILIYYNQPVFLLYDDDLGGTSGLFGPWDESLQNFKGGGAIDQLKAHVPTLLPIYPNGKTDPDTLTREEVFFMLDNNVKLF